MAGSLDGLSSGIPNCGCFSVPRGGFAIQSELARGLGSKGTCKGSFASAWIASSLSILLSITVHSLCLVLRFLDLVFFGCLPVFLKKDFKTSSFNPFEDHVVCGLPTSLFFTFLVVSRAAHEIKEEHEKSERFVL